MGDDLTTCYDSGIFRPFIIGYNQAWLVPTPDSYTFHRRRDIFGRDMTTDFDREGVALVMRLVRDSGGTAVRLWAFEGYMEGIEFRHNLASGNHRIKVYWTAFSRWYPEEGLLNPIFRLFQNETHRLEKRKNQYI
jgi:hypothetical protein